MNIFKSKWGNWETMAMGTCAAKFYLLQARKHENGKVQFRVEVSRTAYGADLAIAEENFVKKIK